MSDNKISGSRLKESEIEYETAQSELKAQYLAGVISKSEYNERLLVLARYWDDYKKELWAKYEECKDFIVSKIEEHMVDCDIRAETDRIPSVIKLDGFSDPMKDVKSVTSPKFDSYGTDLAKRLYSAILAARSIASREHVKADRHERVGIFITCLRQSMPKRMPGVLQKRLWFDIGKLDCNLPGSIEGCTIEQLKGWLQEAHKMLPAEEERQINDSMKELEGCLRGAKISLKDAEAINEQASNVMESLRQALLTKEN